MMNELVQVQMKNLQFNSSHKTGQNETLLFPKCLKCKILLNSNN